MYISGLRLFLWMDYRSYTFPEVFPNFGAASYCSPWYLIPARGRKCSQNTKQPLTPMQWPTCRAFRPGASCRNPALQSPQAWRGHDRALRLKTGLPVGCGAWCGTIACKARPYTRCKPQGGLSVVSAVRAGLRCSLAGGSRVRSGQARAREGLVGYQFPTYQMHVGGHYAARSGSGLRPPAFLPASPWQLLFSLAKSFGSKSSETKTPVMKVTGVFFCECMWSAQGFAYGLAGRGW